ncbi:zinc metalloprotease [Nocardioides perillae]|uniref:Peptidase M43 pregnancy-associated plasma-A domain-containing protein n=1 Tax=Nocardioides perillae TaxID=1119534 RepID=A0A7Y9RTV7_9ACTN|nr:hypothetical protein [Nocardioides perillae]
MAHPRHLTRRARAAAVAASGTALAAALLAAPGLGNAAVPAADVLAAPSPGAAECEEDSGARVGKGATAQEPPLYAAKDAKKYGVIKDSPRLADGSVRVETVFHVITDDAPTAQERARMEGMIAAQMQVLNDAFAGTAPGAEADASDTPFRFDLTETTWTEDAAWAHVAPGKVEREMKAELHQGDSETLNVYAADIGGGLLGWAYFPKGYNAGRDYVDGVVILDESMPGGAAAPYNLGDTLTHEVGHWLMLEHTFAGACSASGDGVADTPREAYPQFGCPEGVDSCTAPGTDPVHNFMDYTDDECMDHFTAGQADRMSDAWVAFRAGGQG